MSALSFSLYGSSKNTWLNPHILTRSLLAQRILLSISSGEKTPSDIGITIGAREEYVIDGLNWLSKDALVKRTDGNSWIANFIILNEAEKKPLVNLARRLARLEALEIECELPRLKAVFKECSFKQQGFSWERMAYIILAALVADLGVNCSLHRKGMVPPPPERPDSGRWYFWGLEKGTDSKRQFGVNSNSTREGGTAHIWSQLVKKPTISPFETDEIPLMLALANHSLESSKIARITRIETATVETKMKKLSNLGYFKGVDGKFKADFPVFREKDLDLMTTEVMRVSNDIVNNIIQPKSAVFRRLFRKIGLDALNREYGAYLCMLYHMMMDHVLDQLVENCTLPEMPKKAPATWGFWGWIGELGLLKLLKNP